MSKLDKLFEYQSAELKKEAYERDIKNTPARARLKKLHAFLKEQQNSITRLTTEVEQKKAAFAFIKSKADKLENDIELEHSEFEQMCKDEECTAEEMTECRENYEKLTRELAEAQKELNEIITWLSEASTEFKATRQKAGKAKKEYDALRETCDKEYEAAEAGLKELEMQANKLAELVDPGLLEKYKEVKRNHQAPLALVENNQCGGCNMSLPMVVIKKVINSQSIVECDNCGRILYARS